MGRPGRKSIDSTNFTDAEIVGYKEKLSERYGAAHRVISLTGLSYQTYFRAMRGGNITEKTKTTIVNAINKVVQSF